MYRLLSFIFCFYLIFTPTLIYASLGGRIDKAIENIDKLRNKIDNMGIDINKTRKSATVTVKSIADIVNEAGQTQTITRTAVVEKKLNKIELGKNFIQRLKNVGKLSGPALAGTLAAHAILEGVGWVMEDGTLVKEKDKDQEPSDCDNNACAIEWDYNSVKYPSPSSACSAMSVDFSKGAQKWTMKGIKDLTTHTSGDMSATCMLQPEGYSHTNDYYLYGKRNNNYENKPSDKIKVKITPEQAGSAMMGEGYNDPVDSSLNDRINNGLYTDVKEAHEADPSGIGNELNNDLLDRAKRAQPTSDGKPAPAGDSRYNNDLRDDKDSSNDRAWNSDGSEASSDTSPKVDPDTGEIVGETTSTVFPVFCEWAHTVCDWYDDWKETDTWLKEEAIEKEDKYEIKDQTDTELLSQMQSVQFNSSSYCPADISVPVSFHGLGSSSINISYQPFCSLAQQIRPMVIMLAWILGAYIVTGRNMKGGSES